MKKVLTVASIIAAIGPFATQPMYAATAKKHKKSHVANQYKDTAPVAVAAEEKPYDWMDGFSSNFTLASNYLFRGVSQTTNLPAVQGGITYTLPVGLYANVWGSNVKFDSTPDANSELDTIVGFRNTYREDLAYDLNFARYNYPGARILNYNEFNSVFNYHFIQAMFSYSGNEYNTHTTGLYYAGGINYTIPAAYVLNIEDLSILALFGHSSLSRAAGNSYNDYNISLSKKIKNFTLIAQWTSTNGRQHLAPYDGSMITGVVSVSM